MNNNINCDGIAVVKRILAKNQVSVDPTQITSIYNALVWQKSTLRWLWWLFILATILLLVVSDSGFRPISDTVAIVIYDLVIGLVIIIMMTVVRWRQQIRSLSAENRVIFWEIVWPVFRAFRGIFGFWPDEKNDCNRVQELLMEQARLVKDRNQAIRKAEYGCMYALAQSCVDVGSTRQALLDEAQSSIRRPNARFNYTV
jgi:hypothetical protein